MFRHLSYPTTGVFLAKCYLQLSTLFFLKNDICILKQIVWETEKKKGIKILVGQADLWVIDHNNILHVNQ